MKKIFSPKKSKDYFSQTPPLNNQTDKEFHSNSSIGKVNNFLPPIDDRIQANKSEQINSLYNSNTKENFENIYHPLYIGEVLFDRYVIKQYLGHGNSSSCWLAHDIKYGNFVAIKLKHIDSTYIDKLYDEVEILKEIGNNNFDKYWLKALKEYYKDDPLVLTEIETIEHTNVIQLLNTFIHYSEKNIKYLCLVYEIMGVNLLELIKSYNYKGIPLPYVRIIVKQILIGLDFLHRICNVIHTDINPENILLCLNKDELFSIQEAGHFDVQRSAKRNKESNNISKNNNLDSQVININDLNNDIIINDINLMDIDSEIKEAKKNLELKTDDINENGNDDNYSIEDLIERPRAASLPKLNLRLNIDNDDNNLYDMDLNSYIYDVENYLKEKKRIINDEKYRKKLIKKNKLLSEAKTIKEKNEIFLFLNKEQNKSQKYIEPDINIKICHFNKACKFNHRKNKKIQTRQYRSPEVILGINYNETADIWSLACMIFELATGDYLFEPKSGENFTKNDDHLSKFIQLLGKIPKKLVSRGANSNKYFNKLGKLKRISAKKKLNIKDILIDKYYFKEKEAQALTDFIMPMLEYFPEKRATARQMLKHPWLNMTQNFDYLMNNDEIIKNSMKVKNNNKDLGDNDKINDFGDINLSDNELYKADDEDNDNNEYYNEFEDEEDSGDENPDKINIANYNNSFAEYGQFIDLTNLDRANPQFEEIMKSDDDN
jgi:serine/threonine-protein kinase SRPK3